MGVAAEQPGGLMGLLQYELESGEEQQELVSVIHCSVWRIRIRTQAPIGMSLGMRGTLLLEDAQGLIHVPIRVSWLGSVTGLRVLAVRPEVRARFRALLKGVTDSSGVIRALR